VLAAEGDDHHIAQTGKCRRQRERAPVQVPRLERREDGR
jgi:hypothetical protein